MANKAYQYYKDLPSWAKGIVVVGGLAVTYFAVKGLVSRIKAQAEQKKAQASIVSANAELDNLKKKGINPTISKAQTDAWADQIVKQFSGADLLLQSYDVVARIFKKLKNDADYLSLVTSFGIRTYPDALWGSVKNVDLAAAIQDECFNFRINDLNIILASNGITYTI